MNISRFEIYTGTEDLIWVGCEGKLPGAVVGVENVEIPIAEEKTPIVAFVSVVSVAERHAGRVEGEIACLVGQIVCCWDARELDRVTQSHGFL